ncbi:MAG TPA: RES family NAD+ phosphorylase [Alloacidobacterium sp.]|nr:RES family NAD+ phosphorylase [Alloacidobacterium sp.]
MTDQPGDHPLPHRELTSQTPLIFTVKSSDVLYRHHRADKDPIYFGTSGNNRFDDPDCRAGHAFGVLYSGEDPQCCFIESCGGTTGVPAVSGAYLDARAMATLELTEDLHFVDLYSTGGLTRIGADGRLFTGSYKIAQRWSRALRAHPSKPDGIRYPSRHDHTRIAYAIFSRPPSTFKTGSLGSLMAPGNRALLDDILSLYQVELL